MHRPIKCSMDLSRVWAHWVVKIRSFEFMILAIAFFCLSALVASGLTTSFDNTINAHVKDFQGNQKLDI
jgi:hypothetical protein